jgi:hypothetical protein
MSKKQQQPVLRERVIVFEHDGYNCDILPVTDRNESRILAGDMSIPVEDVTTWISPHGRVYVLRAPQWYINETKHLAAVEMSTVIHQAVQYQRPGAASRSDIPFLRFLPWILVAALAVMWVIKP